MDARDIWLIQKVSEFQGLETENPFDHLKVFLSIVDNMKADGATKNTSRLRFFYFALKGEAKKWLDSRNAPHLFKTRSFDFVKPRGNLAEMPGDTFRICSVKPLILELRNVYEGWDRIKELVQYQDNSWDDPSSHENVSFISEMTKPMLDGRLKRAHQQLSFLLTSTQGKTLKNPYLICDIYGGAHEADKYDQVVSREQVCLFGEDIYGHPSLLRFYQNNDIPPWGNLTRKREGKEGPDWIIRMRNALADLGASINLMHMPHSYICRKLCGISELKPTRMSIQLADRSIKYPIGVCENLLVKINKFIFPVDFVVLDMDEDELVPIILGRPFLAKACVVIDVYEGKLSRRVAKETVTFNIGKSMKFALSYKDYLYYADYTIKFVKERWMDTIHLDRK
ncbi:DNA-directed DNA polymerase [Tanacetum coccineum]|uniref:DNA-directed DNA polymerase n=1 Tax=Tanacetum coccineum TaxID=301880 RepID=A0ABQ5F861_9ASTR